MWWGLAEFPGFAELKRSLRERLAADNGGKGDDSNSLRGQGADHYAVSVPPTPSPSPLEVILHTEPAPWWQAFAPYAPLLAALIAAWIAWRTLKQRSTADNRAEWWRRAQWALDASTSADPKRREMGQQAINRLGQSPLAEPDDLDFLEIGTRDVLEDADAARRAETPRTVKPSKRPASVSPEERRVQIAAAKARISLDQRRGIETPEWIVALSLEKSD